VPSAIFVLPENGRFSRTACVHQVLQTRQSYNRNRLDVKTHFLGRNNKQNSHLIDFPSLKVE
jgi:hypothetical protein